MTDQPDISGVTTAGKAPESDAPSFALDLDAPAPDELVELAEACGVAAEFARLT